MELLEDLAQIRAVDKNGALSVAAKLPEMLLEADRLAQKVVLRKVKKLGQIVVCGMGGSAISGDLVRDLLIDRIKLPVIVNRSYGVPAFVGPETLLFALSYSGNTEETLSAAKQALDQGAKIICVTSGGKLRQFAESNDLPVYLIPAGYQPRAALPFLLIPILRSLEELGLISGLPGELEETHGLLRKLTAEYSVEKQVRSNPAKHLARKLLDKTPLILGSTGTTEAAGLRFKTQLNENSKVTALLNVFPELNHNEIVNLYAHKREAAAYSLVLLRDDGDNERIKKRIEITKSLLTNQLGGVTEVATQGKTALARVMSLIILGDFASVYLAVLRGVDPTDVSVISKLKKELAR